MVSFPWTIFWIVVGGVWEFRFFAGIVSSRVVPDRQSKSDACLLNSYTQCACVEIVSVLVYLIFVLDDYMLY